MTDVAPEPGLPSVADTTVPHSARIWNYWLGGRLNYPVDRAAGEAYQQVYPQIVDVALASRGLPYHLRRPERVAAFFDGLDLVEPGVVPLPQWRQDPGQPRSGDVPNVGGVGRKA
jgi:hypothetical protein